MPGQVLLVGDVAAEADNGGVVEGKETLDVCEAGERAVGGWMAVLDRSFDRGEKNGKGRSGSPRLSAAMTTPSLYLMATTEVPVTMGDCVCWFAPSGCM